MEAIVLSVSRMRTGTIEYVERKFWGDCPIVEAKPERMHGLPVVKGTRMPADDVVDNYESGSPVEEIAESYRFDAPKHPHPPQVRSRP